MEYIASFILIIIMLAVGSGLLLKFSDKSFEKHQNKYLLNLMKYLNMICSSIILIPFQIASSLLTILLILIIILLLFENFFIINKLNLLIIFSLWLIFMQFFMKILWKPSKKIVNSISVCLKLPENVSEFIGFIFYGKLLIYLLALIFVIINNTEFKVPFINNIIFEEFRKILNSSILIFIAADRIITSIQNWIKNKFSHELR